MANKLSPKAIKLLRKVKRHVLAEPNRLDMGRWLLRGHHFIKANGLDVPKCETIGCIAGWVVVLSDPEKAPRVGGAEISLRAAEILGIESGIGSAAEELFEPTGLCKVGIGPAQSKAHAVAAGEHIDRFIARYR